MDMYALIGRPLGHSFSARYFNSKFAGEGIDARYVNRELQSIEELRDMLDSMPDLRGFNVTIPYKQQILPYLDGVSAEAAATGAVNTVKIEEGRLIGYNTDAPAFAESLSAVIAESGKDGKMRHEALILGTGGASKAVAAALRSLEILYDFVSRTPGDGTLAYGDLTDQIIRERNIIINCTPLGTYPKVDEAPPIPYGALTADHICHDLVYNPGETKFMQLARQQGATVANGLMMLHRQAELAWEIWSTLRLTTSHAI